MKRYHLFAFLVLVAVACGPPESVPQKDGGTSTNDAGEPCNGVCLPAPPVGWFGPDLLWVGLEANAPACSDIVGGFGEVYTGHGYPDGTTLCGACTCDLPSGSCELPATLTAAAASCAGDTPSVAHLSFDSPANWSGTCAADNAIPAGKLCGGVPCVQSVTIAPLTMNQSGCLPMNPPSIKPPPTETTFARACSAGNAFEHCVTGGLCAPATPGPEFKQCIGHEGDSDYSECPLAYPNRNVFYHGDTLHCSPCACDAPIGSGCSGSIMISANSACTPPLLPAISIDEKAATCTDVPPGSALGSKSASELSYHGGSCAPSGGKPLGTVFCCQP